MESWIPTLVATGALGFLWILIRHTINIQVKESEKDDKILDEKIERAFKSMAQLRDESMTNKEHAYICRINTDEIKKHISDENKLLSNIIVNQMNKNLDNVLLEFKNLGIRVDSNENNISRIDNRTRHLKDSD